MNQQEKDSLLNAIKQGRTTTEIVKEFKVSKTTVKYYRNQSGHKARWKRYYDKHSKAENTRTRKRYSLNAEKERERKRKQYSLNPEKERERKRKYYRLKIKKNSKAL